MELFDNFKMDPHDKLGSMVLIFIKKIIINGTLLVQQYLKIDLHN